MVAGLESLVLYHRGHGRHQGPRGRPRLSVPRGRPQRSAGARGGEAWSAGHPSAAGPRPERLFCSSPCWARGQPRTLAWVEVVKPGSVAYSVAVLPTAAWCQPRFTDMETEEWRL